MSTGLMGSVSAGAPEDVFDDPVELLVVEVAEEVLTGVPVELLVGVGVALVGVEVLGV